MPHNVQKETPGKLPKPHYSRHSLWVLTDHVPCRKQIKPYAPIRSSDRRKFAQQIIDELNLVPEGPQSEERDAKIVAVRNSLVPEILTSAKFTTKVGPNLDTVSGVVYTGSHPGEQNRPLWVKYDDVLLPTGNYNFFF